MLIFIEIMDYIGAERRRRKTSDNKTLIHSHLLIPKFPLADTTAGFVDT